MINSITSNYNTTMVRPAERTLPTEQAAVQQPPEQNETVELSSDAREHAQYMQALGKLPDVRADKVSEGRESINDHQAKDKSYPPESIIAGLSILIGDGIQYREQYEKYGELKF